MSDYIKPITILLAEDNEDHAELVIETLEDFNVKNSVIHVKNGEQALALLQRKPPFAGSQLPVPDVILLDIKMPRLDGVSTLAGIKRDERIKHIPVIMISTSTTEKEINRCYELGANSYITKPIRFEEFSRKIKELNLYWVLTTELPVHKTDGA